MKIEATIKDFIDNYTLYLPAIIGLIITLGAAYFVVTTSYSAFDKNQELKKEQGNVQDLQEGLVRLESLQQGGLTELEETVNLALPEEKPVFVSLKAVNSLAVDSETIVSDLQSRPGSLATNSAQISVSTKGAGGESDFESLPIILSVQGTLPGLNTFLNNILSVRPLMELKGVRIASHSSNDETEESIFSSEIELEVFWAPAESSKKPTNTNTRLEELTTEELDLLSSITQLQSF